MARKIKNFERLATTDMRLMALGIAEVGLQAVDSAAVIKNSVQLQKDALVVKNKKFALKNAGRIFVVGIGKCAVDAGLALEEVLGDRLTKGIILTPANAIDIKNKKLEITCPPKPRRRRGNSKLEILTGTHPLPTSKNIVATGKIIKLLRKLGKKDLVIFFISGGGSTLLCQPVSGNCLEEKKIINRLIRAGANIQEINTLRKHLSLARGGYLAKYVYPARGIALIFSDVPGNDIQFVSSGPTVKDRTTVEEAQKILVKYNVLQTCGLKKCGLLETPKEEKYFRNVANVLLVSNKIALEAMAKKARALGLGVEICTDCLRGEARKTGPKIIADLRRRTAKTALLYGGETTVAVLGGGRGGRNQELALSALPLVGPKEILISVASDGRDNTEYAGAICDRITNVRAQQLRLKPEKFLAENDSYEFFKKTGDYLITGITGSNVSDLIIAIKQ